MFLPVNSLTAPIRLALELLALQWRDLAIGFRCLLVRGEFCLALLKTIRFFRIELA